MARDEYATRVHTWWHLSRTPPELLEALRRPDAPIRGRALDLGCGLGTETHALAARGFRAVGVDRSGVALRRARRRRGRGEFLRADIRRLPFADGAFDLLVDRGCFHYLPRKDRPRYAREAARLLRPRGRLLLRASVESRGRPNGIDERLLRSVFRRWRILAIEPRRIPSDTRTLASLVLWLAPGTRGVRPSRSAGSPSAPAGRPAGGRRAAVPNGK